MAVPVPSRMSFYDAATGTFDQAGFDAAYAAYQADRGMLTGDSAGATQSDASPAASTQENNPEGQYLIIPASTRGEAKNPFIAPPEPYYGTEADLREMYDNTNELKDTFGSFDNYLSYSQEVQSNLENADWFIKEDDSWRPSSVEWGVLNGEDRGLSPNEREQAWSRINDRRKNAVKSNYQQWLMQEDTQGLLNKYGIEPVKYDDKGNVYTFTGNNYQMTVKADQPSFADYATAILKVATSAALTFGLTQAFIAPLAQSAGLTYGQTGQIINSLINAGGTAAGAAGSLDNAVNALDVANTANNVINQTDDSFSLFQPVATQQPATSTPSVPGISSAGGFIQGKAQEVIDWVSGQVDGFLSQNPKDAAQTIRDVLEAAGVNLPGGDVKDILEGGFGVRWDDFNPSNLGAGTIFIPGIPTSGFLPSSIDLGTIGDLLSAENPIDQLISMGEEKLNEILEAATDPVGILGAVFQKTDVLPTAVEALITAGGIGQAAIDWYNNRKEEQQSSEDTSPTLPFTDEEEEEEQQTEPPVATDESQATPESTRSDEDLFVTPGQTESNQGVDSVTDAELSGEEDPFGDTTQEDTTDVTQGDTDVTTSEPNYATPQQVIDAVTNAGFATPADIDAALSGLSFATAEDVKTAVENAGYATAEDIDAALAGLDLNFATPEDVTNALSNAGFATAADIDTALSNSGFATAADVTNAIQNSGFATLDDINTALTDSGFATTAEVEQLISNAGFATAEDVKNAVANSGFATPADIDAALAGLDLNFATADDVKNALSNAGFATPEDIDAALASSGFVTEATFNQTINNLNFATAEDVKTAVENAGYATPEDIDAALAGLDLDFATPEDVTNALANAGFATPADIDAALASSGFATADQVNALGETLAGEIAANGTLTKANLDAINALGLDFDTFKTTYGEDLANLEESFNNGLADLEKDLAADIAANGTMTAENAALLNTLGLDLETFRTEYSQDYDALSDAIDATDQSILALTGTVETGLSGVNTRIDELDASVQEELGLIAGDIALNGTLTADNAARLDELGISLDTLNTEFGNSITGLSDNINLIQGDITELGTEVTQVGEDLLSGFEEAALGRQQLAAQARQREFKPAPIPQLSYQPLQVAEILQMPQRDYVNELNQIINRSLFEGMI